MLVHLYSAGDNGRQSSRHRYNYAYRARNDSARQTKFIKKFCLTIYKILSFSFRLRLKLYLQKGSTVEACNQAHTAGRSGQTSRPHAQIVGQK